MQGENWVPVSWAPRWRVSDQGRVMGPRGEVRGTPAHKRGGYPTLRIGDNPKRTRHLHCIVAEAFLGPRPPGLHVSHADGNPLNNAVSNLSYVTPRENHLMKAVHGTQPRGEAVAGAKLTAGQVQSIRSAPERDSSAVLAERFGVSPRSVRDIRTGKTWAHIDTAPPL